MFECFKASIESVPSVPVKVGVKDVELTVRESLVEMANASRRWRTNGGVDSDQ